MTSEPTYFGLLRDLDVFTERDERLVTLQGVSDEGGGVGVAFTLSYYAAHECWFQLTQILYPNEAPSMTDMPTQVPSRSADGRPVTKRITATAADNGFLNVIGTTASGQWQIHLTDTNSKRLWAKLDVVLFPVGWQGRQSDDPAHT